MHIEIHTTAFAAGEARRDVCRNVFATDVDGIEKGIINLYPQMAYQTILGFGGAFTDAAGYVFSRLSPAKQGEVIDAYFGPDGLGYTLGRTHIDSCDFSLGHYEADGDPDDSTLSRFSLERGNRYILPMLRAANARAREPIAMMMTPWSPPAYMKTNGERNHGGYLKEAYYPLWADYICKYVGAYRALGVNVRLLSAQNEPKAVQRWDSCIFTGAQERTFIRDHLRPAMRRAGLEDIGLLIWDHNKERAFDRACETINSAEMESLIDGIAVHWYSGDHFEALQLIRDRFPGMRLVFSEACVEYLVQRDQNQLANARMYAHEMIGSIGNGLDSFIDWNLILDPQGGPNHVGNYCDAPIMCDPETDTVRYNLSYDYIGHFSRHIKTGARRIGHSRFSQAVEVVAAENPDGSICAVLLNPGAEAVDFHLRLHDQVCPMTLAGDSICTCVIR